MKKKYMLMGIAAVLILATMVGGTLAALNTKSEKAVANISIKSVGVTVIGDQPEALADGGEKEPVTIVPGETIVMPKAVQNDIPDGYDVYVKVVIYHAWDTKSGGLVSTGEADDIYVHNQDWIIGYEDDEQTVSTTQSRWLQSRRQQTLWTEFILRNLWAMDLQMQSIR